MKTLGKIRVINVYDIFNVDDKNYNKIVEKILFERNLDYLYETTSTLDDDDKFFRVEFIPGQYNQREDSANNSS